MSTVEDIAYYLHLFDRRRSFDEPGTMPLYVQAQRTRSI
jgi:hypothetical protein